RSLVAPGADQLKRHDLPRFYTQITQRPLVVGGLEVMVDIAISMAGDPFENRQLLFGPGVDLDVEPIQNNDEIVLRRIKRCEPAQWDERSMKHVVTHVRPSMTQWRDRRPACRGRRCAG